VVLTVDNILLSVSDLNKSFKSSSGDTVEALKNLNLEIKRQEFLAIVGPSGCGKSTLLNILAGLYPPDSGTIARDMADGNGLRNIGHISQADTLLPWRTVVQNVELGLELRGVSKGRRRAVVEKLIEQVDLSQFKNNYPFELSGGMKKRAIIIRALAYDPDIIFMDEPFVGLDVQTRDLLEEDILKLWHETRKTIVFVTHDLAEAITLADRVIIMSSRPSTVKSEHTIHLPRPRSTVDIKFTEDFTETYKKIWDDLSAEVKKSRSK